MISIPTKHIDGDVAVGRNVSTGGKVNIMGNVRVAHDLKVEGWLDAKNIKGHHKGHFLSEATLNARYPEPQDGWCAIVGDTLPGILYVVEGRKWVSTGTETGVQMIDSDHYNELLEGLEAELEGVKGDLLATTEAVGGIGAQLEGVKTNLSSVDQTAQEAKSIAEVAKAVTDSKGQSGGIAPLDSNGIVPREHLPESDFVLGQTTGTAYPGDEGAALKGRVDSYVGQLINAQGDIETLQEGVEGATGNIENLTTRVDGLDNQLHTAEGEIAALKRGAETTSGGIAENREDIIALQSGVNNLATKKADVSELERVSTTASAALNSATVATQSVNAALTNSTEAKSAVAAMGSRVEAVGSSVESLGGRVGALEERVVFEEIASEAEWAARKEAGTLEAGKLYYVAEE